MDDTITQPPKIKSLHHVAIVVQDLLQAIDFYANKLGFKEITAPPTAIEQGIRWFDLGDGRALHLVENEATFPLLPAHFAIEVDDVAAWRAYIGQTDLTILEPTVDLYNADRFFLRDPSGNRLELVQWLD